MTNPNEQPVIRDVKVKWDDERQVFVGTVIHHPGDLMSAQVYQRAVDRIFSSIPKRAWKQS